MAEMGRDISMVSDVGAPELFKPMIRQENEYLAAQNAERDKAAEDQRAGMAAAAAIRRDMATTKRPGFTNPDGTPAERIPEFDPHKMEMANFTKKAAGIFAILAVAGSASLRTGSTGAMNALSGALQGLHTGNQAAYADRMAEYENHVKVMIANHNEELQKYYEIQNNKSLTLQEQMDEIRLVAMTHDNNLVKMAASQRSMEKVWSAIASWSKAGQKLKDTKLPASDVQKVNQIKMELGLSTTEALEPEDQAKVDAEFARRYPKGGKGGGVRPFTPAPAGPKTKQEAIDAFRTANPTASIEEIKVAVEKKYPNLK